ncbi:MAG TPA: lysine--tRNA ligase [Dehalococcoidia bacterium]|nr:lysine--tRNA ligase [Dehalococcoidia bacterium]
MPGEDELIQLRREKLARLRSRGIDPYPARVTRTHTAADAVTAYERWEADGAAGDAPAVTVTGRITALRDMGKAAFLDVRDGSGRIQCYLKRDVIGDEAFAGLAELDLGDFLGVTGPLFRTRTREITVESRAYQVLAKALRPPPEKWHGLEDVELRYRQRYLDLMANEEVRDVFRARAAVIGSIRRFLDARGFMEVDTPVLQPEAGGAAATPFVTHHRALDQDFFLRISLELHLKRLIVGGYDRVYEMGRIFRNEGVSWKYNPEFTMLETYEAYADYNDVARMVEQMVGGAARDVLGATTVRFGEHELDLAPPWRRVTMRDALIEHAGIDFQEFRTRDTLLEELRRRKIEVDAGWSWGRLLDEAVSVYVEPKLVQPTFLIDYPKEISPLAKSKADDPEIVERFEVFCAGFELGNAYSELNDPIDQRQRFETQARLAAAGLEEVETLDEDFLVALEHGMPPTGGFGMGVDRLVMILTGNTSIREVILFPQLRKRE